MSKRFTAREVGQVESKPGCWHKSRVGVFDGDTQIGEYVRNYPSYASETFYAFEQAGRWFAVYSPDYTATRLMSLPDCKDIGGEDRNASGFCPTGYYVPQVSLREPNPPDDPEPRVANHDSDRWALKVPQEGGGVRYYWPDDKEHPSPDPERTAAYLAEKERSHKAWGAWSDRYPYVTRYAEFGFMSGCVWGDDWSWKVQYLDLSRAAEGVVKRDDRFGYIWLPAGVDIESGIRVIGRTQVEIAQPVKFDLRTGQKTTEPDDDD